MLRPGGRLIASVDHPLLGHPLLRDFREADILCFIFFVLEAG